MHKRSILYFLFFILLGCPPSHETSRTEYPACMEAQFLTIFREYSSIMPEDFAREIKEIEESSGITLSEEDKTLRHLRLAILLSHYKNPRPDYQRSLKELDIYLLSARYEDKAVLSNFQALLREIIRLEREEKELKMKLELLKSLDIDIEKKRVKPQ